MTSIMRIAAVEALRESYPDADISVWAEDEHRIGMHPVNRQGYFILKRDLSKSSPCPALR